jgi:hypothetical protein
MAATVAVRQLQHMVLPKVVRVVLTRDWILYVVVATSKLFQLPTTLVFFLVVAFLRKKLIFVVATLEVVVAFSNIQVISSLAHGIVDQWTCCVLELRGCRKLANTVQGIF